jgi:glycine oxidase
LFIPRHGFVAAGEFTRAIAAAAERAGAKIVAPTRLHSIRRNGGDVLLDTDRGSIAANTVVIAMGSWSGQIDIDDAARAPVRPVRGQLLLLGWKGDPVRRVTWSDRCYLVPWEDGTLLVGATSEDAGFDERTTVAGVRDLIEAASDLIPTACNASFQSAKVGLRPATPDEVPIIGRSGVLPNVVYATGHYRNGILLSPLTAELVAALVDGRPHPMLELTRPGRFGAL